MKTTTTQVLFWRTADVYSNWHPSPFVLNGTTYANAEQYLMAIKARLFDDWSVEAKIMKTTNLNDMKSLGDKSRGTSMKFG